MLMFNRAFFSLQRPWLPTWVALGNLGLNAVLDAGFYRFGIWGIPLSTSIVNIAGTFVLLVHLRRKLGRLDITRTMSSVLRISLASLVLAGVAYGVWWPLDHEVGRRFVAQVVSLMGDAGVGKSRVVEESLKLGRARG